MKKIISLVIVFVVIFSFCSCRPKGMKKDVYDLTKQAIRLMEDYHAGKISSESVDGPLESIKTQLEAIEKRDDGKITSSSEYGLQNDDYANLISFYIGQFILQKNSSLFDHNTYESLEKIKDYIK